MCIITFLYCGNYEIWKKMGVNTCKIMFMGHFYHFYTLCEEISKFGKKSFPQIIYIPHLLDSKFHLGQKTYFVFYLQGNL